MFSYQPCLPGSSSSPLRFVLRRGVLALPLLGFENRIAQFGPVTRLPEGSELQNRGNGLDAGTLRIRLNDADYIIFKQHLDYDQRSFVPAFEEVVRFGTSKEKL